MALNIDVDVAELLSVECDQIDDIEEALLIDASFKKLLEIIKTMYHNIDIVK